MISFFQNGKFIFGQNRFGRLKFWCITSSYGGLTVRVLNILGGPGAIPWAPPWPAPAEGIWQEWGEQGL